MSHPVFRPLVLLSACFAVCLMVLFGAPAAAQTPTAATPPTASGWTLVKYPQPQPVCAGVGWNGLQYFDRLDCGFGYVFVNPGASGSTVQVQFRDRNDNLLETQTATERDQNGALAWEFNIMPQSGWPAGLITLRVSQVDGENGNFGETSFYLNALGASAAPVGSGFEPGDPIPVAGNVFTLDQVNAAAGFQTTPAAGATFFLGALLPDGTESVHGPFVTNADPLAGAVGSFTATIPGSATNGVAGTEETNFQVDIALRVIDATYSDPLGQSWYSASVGAGAVTLTTPPDELLLKNSFVSATGWVKPGNTYPFRVQVYNYSASAVNNVVVTLNDVDGTIHTNAAPLNSSGTATLQNGGETVRWFIGTLPAASAGAPAVATLVVEARAATLGQDAEIVWKDISSTATLRVGGVIQTTSMTHGPKVIPESTLYNSARYGDRPFPVVPVDYLDRKHTADHSGDLIGTKINSPTFPGSTFNLFQEMSLGQLFPNGTVPSLGIASADWSVDWQGDRYTDDEFSFSDHLPEGACYGAKPTELIGTPAMPERIIDGWYQLPGNTDYYGDDKYTGYGSIGGAVGGVGLLMAIDSGCGPTGKAVYDAAHIADPEIDYSDYDTDKDGVVDFFMLIFAGIGGNGASQLAAPPYDNIWPHSSSLEFYYTEPATGLTGYISDDQLRSLEEVPQCWLDDSYSNFADCAANGGSGADALPVYVRVGPYNVNPEDALDNASVISHEYGHSLGLPDFYSLGSRETYGDWNLMATDKSHHMDIFGKQEMGWIVPRPVTDDLSVNNWGDSKLNTGEIHWQRPDGTPYVLSAANGDQNVRNAEAYVVPLPKRQLIDPQKVLNGTDTTNGLTIWWSKSGNDFGCAPATGRNFDIFLPELANLPADATVTLEFKSYWDIEWDYDYGFVMISSDGESYTALPSAQGYTTPAAQNPNANACQTQYGNGLTGTSGSYAAATQASDRLLGNYPDGGFLLDSYDISALAGADSGVVRFSYATDPGLARPGWFIDDVKVTVTSNGETTTLYQTDFEQDEDERLFPGGCTAHGAVAAACTAGWQRVSAEAGSPADHAYYLELRSRTGFDFDGKGENDRDPIAFQPGLLLVYTDEAHGYGNTGVDNQPAQTPVDANPQPGNATPNLNDAAFRAAGVNSYSDGGNGWTDNYDDGSGSWVHAFDCLGFQITRMVGDTINAANGFSDLEADISFTMGDGCGSFQYGLEEAVNGRPTAVIQVKDDEVTVGESVLFDGSRSYDDYTPTNALAFRWDWQNDGTFDASGPRARHTFTSPGIYTVRLRVIDSGNTDGRAARLFGETTLQIVVDTTVPTAVTLEAQPAATGHLWLLAVLAFSALTGLTACGVAMRRRL